MISYSLGDSTHVSFGCLPSNSLGDPNKQTLRPTFLCFKMLRFLVYLFYPRSKNLSIKN